MISSSTIIVSLLQPAPEIYDLFDDIILMSEGKIVYQGTRDEVLEFFESCGFKCPPRNEVAGFLQEVISPKDQEQYWYKSQETYNFVSVRMFSTKFKESHHVCKLTKELSAPFDNSKSQNNSLNFSAYSLKRWALFRACMSKELLLMRRNSFIYVFKSVQLVILASITMTVFFRT
ncbi:drug-responsive transcription factor pdr3 [Orobanche hederae]